MIKWLIIVSFLLGGIGPFVQAQTPDTLRPPEVASPFGIEPQRVTAGASSTTYTIEIPFVDLPNDITKALRSPRFKDYMRTNAWLVREGDEVLYQIRMTRGKEEVKKYLFLPDGTLK